MIRPRCYGTTTKGRACTRRPTVDYLKDGLVVAHYCTQHAHGAGVMRLLLPLPWEYDTTARCPR